MSRLRKPQANYTQITNTLLRDKRLSLKAKGLYALLFSKPDDWTYIEAVLIEESADGKDSFRSAMRELIQTGWLSKQQTRNPDGTVGNTEWWLSVDGLTVAGKPADGLPADGKSAPTNIDISKTELTKTKELSLAKKEKPNATRGQRLEQYLEGHDQLPTDWDDWCREQLGWINDRPWEVWVQFLDYWRAAPGSKGVKADWPATWRNWCRRDQGRPARGHNSPERSKVATVLHDVLADQLRREGMASTGTDKDDGPGF